MLCPKTLWLLPILLTGLAALGPAWPRAPTDVDVALVLAVDVSTSMDPDEQDLQRRGYVEAFRSPLVHQAIRTGMLGRIAVTYVEWAGAAHPRYQKVVVPWTIVETPKDGIAFADRLARAPVHPVAGTSISGAIDFSLVLLSSGQFMALRRVIDISGDGSNNQGYSVTDARDEAVARGVTINMKPAKQSTILGAVPLARFSALRVARERRLLSCEKHRKSNIPEPAVARSRVRPSETAGPPCHS